MKKVVIYHANCADGFGAAWAANKKFGNEAIYVPAQYGDKPPLDLIGLDAEVFILDFSYPLEEMIQIRDLASTTVVLDHHKTALPTLEELFRQEQQTLEGDIFVCEMKKSGCVLAWEFFFPGIEPPTMLKYIQDRDLWKFEHHGSKQIHAYLMTLGWNFQEWTTAATLLGAGSDLPHKIGNILLQKDMDTVRFLVETNAHKMFIDGHEVWAVNSPTLQSEIGNYLMMSKDTPFAAVYYDKGDVRIVSLRSTDDRMDVSVVAKNFGGGGHRNAAGYKISLLTP